MTRRYNIKFSGKIRYNAQEWAVPYNAPLGRFFAKYRILLYLTIISQKLYS